MMTDIDRIREALQFMPVGGHDERVRVGCMVKSELGDTGRDLWDEWRGDRGNDEAASVWKSISETGKLTIGTLFYEAKANGWRDDGMHQKPTPEEIAERRRIAAERAAKEEAEIARERADTAKNAAAILKAATEAKADHPYLVRKRVSPVATLREIGAGAAAAILGYPPKSGGDLLAGRLLVVPVKQGDGISTLELIDGDKRKAALAGRGSKVGGYWATERLPDGDGPEPLQFCEGVATTLSAKEATGALGIATLSAGNMPAVAKIMRERYPIRPFVFCADLVKATGEPDPHAIEAARSVGGKLAIPDFGSDRDPDMTDFNDMAQRCGPEAVAQAIANASAPARGEHQPGDDDAPPGEYARDVSLIRASDVTPEAIA
jgi:putative DNA primase/helicase